jgi:hypothetical protein
MVRVMLHCGKNRRFHARNSAAERPLFPGEMPCAGSALTDILKKMG